MPKTRLQVAFQGPACAAGLPKSIMEVPADVFGGFGICVLIWRSGKRVLRSTCPRDYIIVFWRLARPCPSNVRRRLSGVRSTLLLPPACELLDGP